LSIEHNAIQNYVILGTFFERREDPFYGERLHVRVLGNTGGEAIVLYVSVLKGNAATILHTIQVHTLISCIRALRPVGREESPASPPSSMEESSMYHSAYADPGIEPLSSPKHVPSNLLATSMYHSAYGTLPSGEEMGGDYDYDERETIGSSPSQTSPLDHRHFTTEFKKRKRSEIDEVRMDWEQHTRRAEVKKLSAQLSINEASLTISSLGRTITEISVPGVKMEFLKRPYDSITRLLVQDLCIVDRIQTFGPEYELVVCSSGRSLLGFSPLDASLSPSSLSAPHTGFEKKVPNFVSIKPENATQSTTEQSNSDSDDFDMRLCGSGGGEPKTLVDAISSFDLLGAHHPGNDEETPPGGSLCALTYTHVSPLSPQHPAVRDRETQQEVSVERLEGEPSIHRINLQCTAIDAIGIHHVLCGISHLCSFPLMWLAKYVPPVYSSSCMITFQCATHK
jgi:hypothetical protein